MAFGVSSEAVQSVSFHSLVTDDSEVYHKACEFYSKLGFRVMRGFSKISSNGLTSASMNPNLHLGISNDSLKELWFQSFPLQEFKEDGEMKPWQECSTYNGDFCPKINNGAHLRLRLSSVPCVRRHVKEINFFSAQLSELEEIITNSLKVELKKSAPGTLEVVDPFGTTLIFTNKENELSQNSFESVDEYLLYRTNNLLKIKKEPSEKTTSDLPVEQLTKKKKIAVMTSGGDAPGMNPAVRAVVRAGIYLECDVFAVYEGYEGLVAGGNLLKQLGWDDVKSFLSLGGTAIGTARSARFRERKGRLQAAYNMIINGIDALIVCGGDGSLTGADLFRQEWPSLLEELVKTQKLSQKDIEPYLHLTIVGLVGSIDNDMSSTDATIGAYSSLERITEMVDYIDATAASHSRAFVVEVMGRHCGWLALMSGIATGADFIFIPERPPKANEWRKELQSVCARHRKEGKRNTTVIVAEGAIDDELNPISSEEVKKTLVELGLDTRVTILGHVQRGGTAVAFDRILATVQGVDAVRAVLELTPDDPSPMIGILENKVVRRPLVEAVSLTKSVAIAIEAKNFDKAMSLRDNSFEDAYKNYFDITLGDDAHGALPENQRLNIGVVHVGASSSGLNAATRAITLYCISKGHKLFAIQDGFAGLIANGKVKELSWLDVQGWHNKGGSEIGTNRRLPSENFGNVAYYLQKYNLNGLIIIGGFESFTALHELESNRDEYPVFNMPLVVIPATISNNVPGSATSLGSDTCMNQLVNYCDAVKQSASSSRRRVFVVEVQGGHSGFVASCCGLITGSIATYTPESNINLDTIQEDIDLLFQVFSNDRGEDKNGKMIIRNEQASSVYTTELLSDIIQEAAKGKFETRTAIPGHVQQGFTPSSMDRAYAVKFGVKSCQFIEEWTHRLKCRLDDFESKRHHFHPVLEQGPTTQDPNSAAVIGILGSLVTFNAIRDLYDNEADVVLRKGRTVHWQHLTEVGDMLSGRLQLRKKKNDKVSPLL